MGRKEFDFELVQAGTSPACKSADLPAPDSPTRKMSLKSLQRFVSRLTSSSRPMRCSGRSALNQRASGQRRREPLMSSLKSRLILSSDIRAPEMSSRTAITSQTHGERLSLVTASTASRQSFENPGRRASKPLIAVMTPLTDLIRSPRLGTDLIRSPRLGAVAAMALFLKQDQSHKQIWMESNVISGYVGRECFSSKLPRIGNAVPDAPRRPAAENSGRRASKTAFPRGPWERVTSHDAPPGVPSRGA